MAPVIITTTWADGVDGDWNSGSNWTDGVPLVGGTALITAKGTYTVTSAQSNSCGNLEVAKKATLAITTDAFDILYGTGTGALDGTITVGPQTTLGLGSDSTTTTFENDGTIELNGPYVPVAVQIAGTVTLNGKGSVELDSTGGQIASDGNAATLTNNSTLSGSGTIGDAHLSFVNGAKGIVDGNGPVGPLYIAAASVTNSGLMEATDEKQLGLSGDIVQNGKGQIKAASRNDEIELNDATIDGGAVAIGKGAFLFANGACEIDTATPFKSGGTVESDGGSLTIDGAVKNSGTLYADGGALKVDGAVTGGNLEIASNNLELGAPSSVKHISFDQGANGTLILDQQTAFKATITGMAGNINAKIDLEAFAWADNPFTSSKNKNNTLILTVTDPVKNITDVFKLVGSMGSGSSEAADGSTLIYDPPPGPASVPSHGTQLLVQSMASLAAGGSAATHHGRSDGETASSASWLASPLHGAS